MEHPLLRLPEIRFDFPSRVDLNRVTRLPTVGSALLK